MLRMEIDNSENVAVDYQTGATITRTVEVEGLPVSIDLDRNGRIVRVNCEAQGYDARPVRLLVREG